MDDRKKTTYVVIGLVGYAFYLMYCGVFIAVLWNLFLFPLGAPFLQVHEGAGLMLLFSSLYSPKRSNTEAFSSSKFFEELDAEEEKAQWRHFLLMLLKPALLSLLGYFIKALGLLL